MTLRHSARLHRRMRQEAARQLPPPQKNKFGKPWKFWKMLGKIFHFNISNLQVLPPLEGIKSLRNLVPRVSPSVLWPLHLCAPAH